MTEPDGAADDPARPHIPGDPPFWMFIIGDMLVFAFMFCAFSFARGQEPAVFAEGHARLNQTLGLINTLLLLTSSWFVASGVNAARGSRAAATPVLLAAGVVCAIGFCVIKGFEYAEKIRHGDIAQNDSFLSYYFVITGIHLFHVVVAIGVMSVIALRWHLLAPERRAIQPLETAATLWHLVDLLWIFLFALIYMMA